MDFTFKKYKTLLHTLKSQGFSFSSNIDLTENADQRTIILRHDVDKLPENSLEFAKIEAGIGLKGTYYFRAVPESRNEQIIIRISDLGHEVGYHYEDVSLAAERLRTQGTGLRAKKSKKYVVSSKEYEEFEKELVEIAIESFAENLENLRKIAPVKTICMHGSPLSRWDSRLLWKYYDYHDFGIIGEPYFDINFDKVLYLTDTGRRWNGENVAVRDKAQGSILRKASDGKAGLRAQGENPYKDWKVKPFKYREKPTSSPSQERSVFLKDPGPRTQPARRSFSEGGEPAPRTPHPKPFPSFHSTYDIIRAANEGRLPDQIMMTFHPQRWTDKTGPWVKELVWQNVKNVGKFFIVKARNER